MPSARDAKIRVAHVITGLGTGGAEAMLVKLVSASQGRSAVHTVLPLKRGGAMEAPLRQLGVAVHPLGMSAGVPDPTAIFRLARLLRLTGVDVVQTWLYHGDLIGGLAARLARLPVAWGVHHAVLDPAASKNSTRLVMRICAMLSSRIPNVIVACSHASVSAHVEAGYSPNRFEVIPNGFDLERFRPAPAARPALRLALGIGADAIIVGHVGRWNPNKDYVTLLRAARQVIDFRRDVHFALVGDGIVVGNPELAAILSAEGLSSDRVHLLGRRGDVPDLMAGFDVLCQSSLSEAFPSVLGEAMACGVPCAATDVGDSGIIIGDAGKVVPPRTPRALAEAVLALLSLDPSAKHQLAIQARASIAERYGLDSVVSRYLEVYRHLTTGK